MKVFAVQMIEMVGFADTIILHSSFIILHLMQHMLHPSYSIGLQMARKTWSFTFLGETLKKLFMTNGKNVL